MHELNNIRQSDCRLHNSTEYFYQRLVPTMIGSISCGIPGRLFRNTGRRVAGNNISRGGRRKSCDNATDAVQGRIERGFYRISRKCRFSSNDNDRNTNALNCRCTLQKELDLTAPNKAAMMDLTPEKKWQIYRAMKKVTSADLILSRVTSCQSDFTYLQYKICVFCR